jgi:hypothetical protein
MSSSYRICKRCLEQLHLSQESQEDVATFLLAVGAHGIEVVPENECQAGLSSHLGKSITSEIKGRTLADVTASELEAATSNLLRQLRLPAGAQDGLSLAAALKENWLRAKDREDKAYP